jgi:hypothetical protein
MIETIGFLSFGAVCGWNAVMVARTGRSVPKLILFMGLMGAGALAIGHAYGERPGLAVTALGLTAGVGAALTLYIALGRGAAARQRAAIT